MITWREVKQAYWVNNLGPESKRYTKACVEALNKGESLPSPHNPDKWSINGFTQERILMLLEAMGFEINEESK
jgi:hypothetical protein